MKKLISNHGVHARETCEHARGARRDILDAYRRKGFSQISITEHLPPDENRFLYPDELNAGFTAAGLTDRFTKYWVEQVPSLRAAYPDLNLLIGFETEFYGDDPLERLAGKIEQYKPEIIVGSVHHVHDVPIDFDREAAELASRKSGGDEGLFLQYYQNQFELIQFLARYASSTALVLGHLDLIRIFRPDFQPTAAVIESIERNIKAAIAGDLVIEVNTRALMKKQLAPYPAEPILQKISALNGKITFSDDSHDASDVGCHYQEAATLVRKYFDRIWYFSSADGQIRAESFQL